jgi:hypothetical protein
MRALHDAEEDTPVATHDVAAIRDTLTVFEALESAKEGAR